MRIVSLLLALLLLAGCSSLGAEVASPEAQPSAPNAVEELDHTDAPAPAAPEEIPASPPKGLEDRELGKRVVVRFCWAEDCPGHLVNRFQVKNPPQCDPPFTIDLTMVGDCLLATYMGQYYEGSFSWYAEHEDPTYFFEKVADYFAADDFTIANLETVLTDRPLTEIPKGGERAFWFKGPTKNTAILTSSSVEVVSVSNNHTGDYGEQGIKDTIAAVEEAGLLYGNMKNTVYLEKNGFVIAVICCGLWGEWQTDNVIQLIQEAEEQSDYQIVYFHGGLEGIYEPEEWKIQACRRLVDSGADLVVGCHPHVLQPMEEYNGARILYSLGNFCFGGNTGPKNRTVMYQVQLTVQGGTVTSEEHQFVPCYVFTGWTNNWQPAPIEDEQQKQNVLDFMAWKRSSPF